MEKQLAIIAYLLAKLVAKQEGSDCETVIKEASEAIDITPKKRAVPLLAESAAAISRVYDCYPAKCPISKRPTGKSAKDREKLARILAKVPEEKLVETINQYLKDCIENGVYIKNFSTFLNNLPDYDIGARPSSDEERLLSMGYQ